MTLDEINDLMGDAGRHDEEIAQVLRTADDAWAIVYGAGPIEIEYSPYWRRLVFSAVMGTVPDDRRADVHDALMLYAMLWKESGALRFGVGGRGGAVVAMVDLADSEITAERIAMTAHRLAAQAGALYPYITSSGHDTPAPSAEDFHLIRA